jgi:pilus assembly protein CpaE
MANNNTEHVAQAVLLSGNQAKRDEFESLFIQERGIEGISLNVSSFAGLTEHFSNQLNKTNSPLVIIIADDIKAEEAMQLSAKLDELRPDGSIIWMAPSKKADANAAMRAGIRAILAQPANEADFKKSVIDNAVEARKRWESVVAKAANSQRVAESGSVIAVISPKGGVGKTTVSTNLAVGLAQKSPNQVVLLDLDVQFGDVASALGLEPTHSLLDIVKGPARHDRLVLKSFMTDHESSLRVIPAPFAPEEASLITVDEIVWLLETLMEEFEYVVIDTAPGFNEMTLSALEVAEETVIVSELDVPSIRGVRKALDVLVALNMPGSRRRIVMNNLGRDGGLKLSDARKLISETIDAEIPASTKVVYSTNEGVPVLSRVRRDKAARELQKLVDLVTRSSAPSAYATSESTVA